MTGLTTNSALSRFQSAIKQSLSTKPRYLLSPFISWYTLIGIMLYMTWIVFCGIYANKYILVLSSTVFLCLLTCLILSREGYLSYREKPETVQEILRVIQAYSVDAAHSITPCSDKRGNSSSKLGFYLKETYSSSSSVSVVRVYRNGKVVSVARTLLVDGDVIVLNPGQPAPTACQSLDGDITLQEGDILSDKKEETTGSKHCIIVSPRLPDLFNVQKTDYKDKLIQFLQHNKQYSKLSTEIGYVMNVLHVRFLPVVMVLSSTLAVLQYKYLTFTMESCLVTLLPLLPTIYPLYYTILYYICTARVILTTPSIHTTNDLVKSPDENAPRKRMTVSSFRQTLLLTYNILRGKAYRYLPRNANIFDTLASMTVLCTINKEGILSHPNPNVERIMLLDPVIKDNKPDIIPETDLKQESPDLSSLKETIQDTATKLDNRQSYEGTEDEDEGTLQSRVGSLPNLHGTQGGLNSPQTRSLQSSMIVDTLFSIQDTDEQSGSSQCSRSASDADKKPKVWLPRLNATAMYSKRKNEGKEPTTSFLPLDISQIHEVDESSITPKTKKKRTFWRMMQKSRQPKYKPILGGEGDEQGIELFSGVKSEGELEMEKVGEVVAEQLKDDFIVVLNISLCKQSPLGLSFNRTDMDQLRDCLKPVGLAVLLNNMCRMGEGGSLSRHLYHISVQTYCGLTFKLPLPTDYCNCVVGREIGFTRAALHQYEKLSSLITHVPQGREEMRRTQRNPADDMSPLTCIVSSVMRDKGSLKRHIFSCGTAPLVMKCCYNYWNGQQVMPLQPEHRARILEFYNQNRLTSHCFVLAYRPLLEDEELPQQNIFLSLPKGTGFMDENTTEPLDAAESILKLQVGQTFLGVICAQFQPKHDMVSIVETLVSANIRFVHFSHDNELRSRAFGIKLGLETGWNCHISLADDEYDNFSVDSSTDGQAFFYYYNKARLPQGIKNIKPHLANVDNVPLLVPLFTSCTPPAIKEMISIMQENEEIVCCIGSSLQFDNFELFWQADSSIGMIPLLPQQCLISGIKDITLPWCSDNYFIPPKIVDFASPNCLHLASVLNTVPCSLVMGRDTMLIEPMIRTAREMSVAFKQSGHLAISMYTSLSLYGLIHQCLMMPPPLSLSLCLFVCLVVIPLLASSPFTLRTDSKIMQLHTGKRLPILSDISQHCKYYVLRWIPLFLLAPVNTVITLDQMCDNCTLFLGSRSTPRFSPFSVSVIQHYNFVIVSFVLCAFSFSLAHRTKALNLHYFRYYFTKWAAVVPLVSTGSTLAMVLLSIFYLHISLHLHVLSLALLSTLPCIQLVLCELTKMWDRRLFTRYQRRQKLQFGTKLGMNSPF